MFVYLLIGLELALLYGVFWYVFVREPKPYNVNGDMWGSYTGTGNRDNVSHNHFQSEIDSLIMDAREKAIDNLGFERRVPRPAFPTPLTLSSAYDPSLYSMPSSHCTPGIHRSASNFGQTNDPRDPYLDYPETSEQIRATPTESRAKENVLNKMLNQTLGWFENISVKRP
ncbi:MAG: hypothetical protein P4L53_25040 [Candidatus Obscuribacterales bacterium]|nr:hypothetical protein [Candidatus Obscuribacterales bacterium]